MNGAHLERILSLIDSSVHVNMQSVRDEMLRYLTEHGDQLASEISDKGYGFVPTQLGQVKVSREDLETIHA